MREASEFLGFGSLSNPPSSSFSRAMDSPAATQLFRRLFRHPACPSRRNLAHLAASLQYARTTAQRRRYSTRGWKADNSLSNESDWQQRSDMFPADMSEEYNKYPMVTAKELRTRKERPRRVKMLMRDFIEGACSNPTLPG